MAAWFASKPGPSCGSPLARWRKPQVDSESGPDRALLGFNPWSVSARSEHLQAKHGANESAYDTSRGRTAKESRDLRAQKESRNPYSPNEMGKSFGLYFLHSDRDRNKFSPFYMRVSIAVCAAIAEQTKKLPLRELFCMFRLAEHSPR